MLAEQLRHLDAVNVGAAGTFVIRRPVARAQLRAELARRLPFDAEIVICQGREIVRLMSQNHFAGQPVRPDIVRFVSVLSRRPNSTPSTPRIVASYKTAKPAIDVAVVDSLVFVVVGHRLNEQSRRFEGDEVLILRQSP